MRHGWFASLPERGVMSSDSLSPLSEVPWRACVGSEGKISTTDVSSIRQHKTILLNVEIELYDRWMISRQAGRERHAGIRAFGKNLSRIHRLNLH